MKCGDLEVDYNGVRKHHGHTSATLISRDTAVLNDSATARLCRAVKNDTACTTVWQRLADLFANVAEFLPTLLFFSPTVFYALVWSSAEMRKYCRDFKMVSSSD